jgi:curved DNA-binding protein CbpA
MIFRPRPLSATTSHPRPRYRLASKSRPWFYCGTFPTRPFTSSSSRCQQQTHYDVLGVPTSVSRADLKKRFYVLSKENHPDLHSNSKEHTTRFQQISESYTVLADSDKRRKYDRDVMQTRPSVRSGSGFAGARPATGLSKRRSAFKRPPPSFYGKQANPSQSQSSSPDAESDPSGASSSAYAWGPEPQFQQTADFDPKHVFRTQSVEDERRDRRRAAAAAAAQHQYDEDGNMWARFVMVTVIVVAGTTVGSLLVSVFGNRPTGGGMVRGDGSLRRSKAKDGG